MDGLIKGLINVALDHAQGGDRDQRDGDQPRDERSRSTWAEVVSGEQDDGGVSSPNTGYSRIGARQTATHEGRFENEWESGGSRPSGRIQKAEEGRFENEEWESGGSRPPQRFQKEADDDGWETVGKKHPKPCHKVPKEQWNNYKCSPTDQNYSDEVECGADPSEEELSDLATAANKLWELDFNRVVPGKDYEIDCGEGKKVYQKEDMAEGSLFSWLNEEIFTRPTYSRFCALLDNYNPHEGYKEQVTAQERAEQEAFIEEISRTAPIKYLHKYLVAKGIASDNYHDFKRMMTGLWFDLYARGGTSGSSSAFEHVFVGEIKCGEQEVSGFHNWIQFYLEEAKGKVDYQGYIFPRRRRQMPDSETQLLTIQFEWNGVLKSVSSTLIGVSPEFEIALYTLCFYLGREDNHLELGPYPVNIKCYRHRDRLGSAFPVAGADC